MKKVNFIPEAILNFRNFIGFNILNFFNIFNRFNILNGFNNLPTLKALKYFRVLLALVLTFGLGIFQCQSLPGNQKAHKYATCTMPTRQSPIDLIENQISIKNPASIELVYTGHHQIVKNLGHTIEVEARDEGYVIFQYKRYNLLQYHFHTPSEHRFDHKVYPMEMHLVHKSKDRQYLVIAYPFAISKQENPLIQDILNHLTTNPEENLSISLKDGITIPKLLLHYSGSLTTPPYTEGVEWLISKEPSFASLSQIQLIMDNEGYNNRNIQNSTERKVDIINNINFNIQ